MESKTKKLNDLFEKWKETYGTQAKKFNEDGIVDEEAWECAPRKVLFLLKETNNFIGDFRVALKEGPWKVIGYWAYGVQNVEPGRFPSFASARKPENYRNACISSAVVNLKKLTGGSVAKKEEIQEAAQRDSDFICEELQTIEPDIVVCCSSFDIARSLYSDLEAVDSDGKCYKQGKTPWIDFCHPSARYRHDMMYYTLIALYQNCLLDEAEANTVH